MGAKNLPPKHSVSSSRILVAVISPSRLFRECLVKYVGETQEFQAVDCSTGEIPAVQAATELGAELFLVDLDCRNPFAVIRHVLKALPSGRVVGIGRDSEPDFVG